MRLSVLLSLILASLPLAADASASISTSIRIVSQEWLASHDSRLLASQRKVTATSLGTTQENGTTYLRVAIKGNSFKFEIPQGTEVPTGTVQIAYVPVQEQGRQRLVAMSLNDRDLNRLR